MAATPEAATVPENSLRTWLFNPFHYIAGGKALAIGVVLILAAGLVGSLSESHFDGVLDFHTGPAAPLWLHLSEGLIDWLVLSAVLLLGGIAISRSRLRPLDVVGTQALARAPTLVTALFALLPGHRRFAEDLLPWFLRTSPEARINPADAVAFGVTLLVCILMVIWMVALMYRSFSVSCNVSGRKAIWVFIAAIIVAECISKVLILRLPGGPLAGL